MSDIFTIVSLVVAVSGATYAALAAFRSVLGQRVDRADETSHDYIESIRKGSGEALKKTGEKKYRRLRRWLFVWRWSYIIPIALFNLLAYWIALHVCVTGWAGKPTLTSSWQWYRCAIVGLVLFDGIALVATFCVYPLIVANAEDLKETCEAVSENQIGTSS